MRDWYYYPGSAWMNFLFVSGYEFETPIPMITREGVKPFPPTGYRTLDARTAFFYGVTGITPAMAMRLPGIGSQYLFAMLDANKKYFDGAKTYKVTLPKGIPEANFWSFTLYDNQTRSMLDTPQRYPRAGSQSYPSPAAEAGRRRLDDGLLRSDAAGGRQARQLDPDRCPARAGSRSCASTARSNRSSTRPGGRARSNWYDDATQCPLMALSGHAACALPMSAFGPLPDISITAIELGTYLVIALQLVQMPHSRWHRAISPHKK